MNSNIKISVIVPSYNQGEFIENIIQCVINQDYSNWELIIQDNASTDSTESICNKFASIDSRITFVSENDKGYADAVNKALERATGQIGIIQSSDDFFASPHVFSDVIKIWKLNPDLIILSGLAVMVNEKFEHLDIQKNKPSFISPEQIYMGHYFNQSATFFSIQCAIDINKLDVDVDMVADTDFWIRLSCQSPKALVNRFLQVSNIWGGVVVQPNQRSAELSKFYKGRVLMAYKHYTNDAIPFAKEFKKNIVNNRIYQGISYFKEYNLDYDFFTDLYKDINSKKFQKNKFIFKEFIQNFIKKRIKIMVGIKFFQLYSSKAEALNDKTINSYNNYKWW
jgi:glycosyltransferase involved in cell wall biosynthesis